MVGGRSVDGCLQCSGVMHDGDVNSKRKRHPTGDWSTCILPSYPAVDMNSAVTPRRAPHQSLYPTTPTTNNSSTPTTPSTVAMVPFAPTLFSGVSVLMVVVVRTMVVVTTAAPVPVS